MNQERELVCEGRPEPSRIEAETDTAISWSFASRMCLNRAAPTSIECKPSMLIVWIDHHEVSDDGGCTITNLRSETCWIQINLHGGASASTTELSNVLTELLDETPSILLNQVYLVASGTGAAVAMKLLLMRPEDFQGIALFNPDHSELPSIDFTKRLGHLRAMLVTSIKQSPNVRDALTFGRCLHSAGMRITTHFYLPRWFSQERMLQDLADWVSHDDRLKLARAT